jgi:hypothetical protein
MKIAGLIIGILLMVLSSIVLLVCLALPSATNNRVNFEEALLGIIPSVLVFFLALVVTVLSALMLIKGKKNNAAQAGQTAPPQH